MILHAVALVLALTPAEVRGRHIYRTGESPAGRPITAVVQGSELGAGIFPCASCHGMEGRGVPEGNVEPSDIRWSTLQKISVPQTGRKRPKYDEAKLARAIREGVDSMGNPLSPVMPRFKLGDDDLSDLIAYLKRLGDEPQPGLSPDSITVTTTGPGTLTRKVIEAYFKDVNEQGGVFGRKLRLDDVAPDQAFAVINAAEGTEETLGAERVPVITPFPSTNPSASSFFLFADLETQVLALERHAGEGTVHVIHDATPAARAAAEALSPDPNAERNDGDQLFLIGAGVDASAVLRGLGEWSPRVFLAGANIDASLFDLPKPLQIFLAVPALPTDLTDAGRREITSFAARHGLPPEELRSQLATYAAVKVFVEGLKRAGREVTRETLITALEQLYQFPTEVTPPVTFSRNRHIGSAGAHVIAVDLEKRGFVPVGWVRAER